MQLNYAEILTAFHAKLVSSKTKLDIAHSGDRGFLGLREGVFNRFLSSCIHILSSKYERDTFVNTLRTPIFDRSSQTVDKVQSTVNLKKPKKPKGKGSPHVEYNYINTTRKKTRR